ncbi:MAG: SDR family NAD(P)-dependent oxidoreductase [Treponema sp.]|nr:SDR family NAD(P)-dependent oxidoreductase [Treponema sp.]
MRNIAIITGASSGLGKEFSIQISKKYDFDEIWLIARRQDKLEELAEEINSQSKFPIARPIVMDIQGKEGVKKFEAFLKEENEKLEKIESGINIELLINNAGFGTYGPFEETPLDRQLDMIDLNCTALTGICGVALPFLKKGSHIINTASLAAFMPLGNFAVYAASKAYVLNFSIALAAELKDKGIEVCALCPGSVSTEFAKVASNGARKEVKGGHDPVKVVAHCLKKAYKNKKVALWHVKWNFNAFLSRIVSRYSVARITYKYNKRPYKQDKKNTNESEAVSLSEFN